MDYEKKYKEALERAKKAKEDTESAVTVGILEEVFPELCESEDEKIRKTLKHYLEVRRCQTQSDEEYINCNNFLAWLEKQGKVVNEICKENDDSLTNEDEKIRKALIEYFNEQCDMSDWNGVYGYQVVAWLEKQDGKKSAIEMITPEESLGIDSETYNKIVDECIYGEQKPINKIETKFKVGDWITDGQLTCKVLGITDKSYELHLYNDDYCNFETDVQSVDKHYHLWTIKDAKNGDILTSISFHSNCTFIFNGLDNWKFDEPNGDRAVATGYCCLTASANKMEFGIQGPGCIEVNTVKPATKTQRDLLFFKMKEAGYEWDTDKKELKKIHVIDEGKAEMDYCFTNMMNGKKVSSAWGEEDERTIKEIDEIIYECPYCESKEEISNWLKSLKDRVQPQPKREWSEEDEEYINDLIGVFDGQQHQAHSDEEVVNWLKSLRPQNHWKPSDEQIEALWNTLHPDDPYYVDLLSLYNDLKKLI